MTGSASLISRNRAVPALALVLVVTGTGIGSVVATSLGLFPLFGQARLSVNGYTEPGSDLLMAVRETLTIATLSTILASVLGVAIATVVLLVPTRRWLVGGLAAVVLTVPHLVGAASIDLLIGDTGLLPRWLGTGSGRWPDLVGGTLPVATVLEFAWKESAFVAVVIVATTRPRLADLLDVAAVLGADPWQRWSRVLLPSAMPAMLGAALITFVYTAGSYEVPWLLGRTYPEPLPVMAYRLFSSIDLSSRPQAAAAAALGAAVAVAAVIVSTALVQLPNRARARRRG